MIHYKNTFFDVEAPVDDATLAQVENELKFVFPREIREHYLSFNGGCPKRCVFREGECVYVVQEFLPVRHGRKDGLLEDACRDLRNEREIIPPHLIPFAFDPGGDYFCFGTNPGEAGAIYFFAGEYADDPQRAVSLLASTLREFVERLQEDV